MKALHRLLQRWRIAKARRFIASGARVLDIGSADGALFQALGSTLGGGLGIDPTLRASITVAGLPVIPGFFPQDMPEVPPFDVVTMLAVLEHFPTEQYQSLRMGCWRFLRPGGRLIITVPSPQVDHILQVLQFLHLIDGMSLEEHHGYEVSSTVEYFHRQNFISFVKPHFSSG